MLRLLSLFCSLSLSSTALCFSLVKDYSGANFFNDKQGNPLWDFYGSWDNLTLGDVWWLNSSAAFAQRLAYVNGQNQVVLKVDNSSVVPLNQKRNSVRIETRDLYGVGSLWIVDIAHVPFGCSVWPAFWTYGGKWPDDGEIDILEAINMQTGNQMALHTLPGCNHSAPSNQRGVNDGPDCSTAAGCVVHESAPNSFGTGFNNAGGGVWATQFDVSGIYIWFWTRNSIPAYITQPSASSTMDISTWGPPSASFPATTCNVTKFFAAQRLVFDITLCGNWAGETINYLPTCSGAGPTGNCYQDNVVGAGSPKYDQAYFEVNYLRAYTTGLPTPSPTAAVQNVGSKPAPSHRNSGTSSYLRPLRLLSLVVVTNLLLICASW